MTPERWRQITEVFHAALARDSSARASYLDLACGTDRELRDEVDAMLVAHATGGRFGEIPVSAASGATTRLAPGAMIGPYRVERLIGAGGMGEVYRARDTRLARDVAIKVLPTTFVNDTERLARFEREARLLAALDHPNIAAIHGIEDSSGAPALVLELVEGVTLADRLAQSGPLPLAEALQVARQIAAALGAAHQKDIVHRDLKPANITITPAGVVKVLDFGLAKALAGDTTAADLSQAETATAAGTLEGVIVGTPTYMSPEQVRGRRLDTRTDIWSFGCVFYEALTGRQAFAGETLSDTIARILEREPESIRHIRDDVPGDVERVLRRCLEKDVNSRYASAVELAADLATCEKRLSAPTPTLLRVLNRPVFLIPLVALGVVAAVALWLAVARSARVRWAHTEAIPQIERYAQAGEWEAAYGLAKQVEKAVPDDAALAALWPTFSWMISVPSDPPGAKVFRRTYAGEDGWEELGTTPLERIHFPFGYSVVRVELAGYRPLVRAFGFPVEASQQLMRLNPFTLDTKDSLPEGKVRVPGRPPEFGAFGDSGSFRDFFLGQYEVTNREYKRFVDGGGYQRKEFWEHPFVQDGKEIPWEDAMSRFKDRSGRPGPSTWEGGDYREGQGDYPVSGVSWYEAAAYARFVGEELPTITQWRFAVSNSQPLLSEDSWIVPASNVDGHGPAPIGQFKGLTWSGAYDMIGNVREWCFNAVGDKRVIAGGAWNSESAAYNNVSIRSAISPLDRSETNGLRLALSHDDPETAAKLRLPLTDVKPRDLASEKPVSDESFSIYRRMYGYDPLPLNAKVEASESAANWTRERVSFDNSYGERTITYLYLPRTGSPPYQTLIYYPGEVASVLDSIDQYRPMHIDFILKSGRAVAFPIFKGYFERRYKVPPSGPNAQRQRWLQVVNDLRRTIDYLAMRKDIDSTRFGYYGYSTGGWLGPIVLAVEPRLRVSVFYLAGIAASTSPEVDPVTFLPRTDVPVLMLSGELDSVFPLDASAKPFFRLLGTKDKKHVIAPGGHFVPRALLIRETLDWLDRYLGPVTTPLPH